MILEAAPLHIRPGSREAFEAAFERARHLIASIPGFLGLELQRCLERENEYLLLVRWTSVQAHEQGFRGSPQYQDWKALLHHFYEPFPVVSHYAAVAGAGMKARA